MTSKKTDLLTDNLTDWQKRNLDIYVGKIPGYTIDLCLTTEDAHNLQEYLTDRNSNLAERIASELETALEHCYEQNKLIKIANQLYKQGKLKKIIEEAKKES